VKYVLDMMVVLTWLGMSLAVVSLVGHYRMTHAGVRGADNRNEYRADRDMALKIIVFAIGVLSVIVMFGLNRLVG
jgi:hypothetical protein